MVRMMVEMPANVRLLLLLLLLLKLLLLLLLLLGTVSMKLLCGQVRISAGINASIRSRMLMLVMLVLMAGGRRWYSLLMLLQVRMMR